MDRRFELRKQEMLAQCQVRPQQFAGMRDHLKRFVEPFAGCLRHTSQRRHAEAYVAGLTSHLRRKNVESIAYLHDQDRRNLQHFMGGSSWDHRPLQQELVQQVAREIGQDDAVIVFDPSGFAKQGEQSVGVARQWLGRLGKVDNGQVGVFMGYVSGREHALVDTRLYLPKSWDRDRKRRKKCGVPREVKYQTRHALALEMLEQHRDILPHAWVSGDDEMGRASRFRLDLAALGETYLLAVPCNTTIRDLEGAAPIYQGRGPRPKRRFEQVQRWIQRRPSQAWTPIQVRDGEKGPLCTEMTKRRVQAKTDQRRVGPEETLIVTRTRQDDGQIKCDYYLSNAPLATPLQTFARVAFAEHRIEECIKRSKSQTGLADYELRTWSGWHHHQVLSMIATWFLARQTQEEKKIHSGDDVTPGAPSCGLYPPTSPRRYDPGANRPQSATPSTTQRTCAILSLETT